MVEPLWHLPKLVCLSAMLDACCIVVKDGRGVVLPVVIVGGLAGGEVEQHAGLAAFRRARNHTFDWHGTCHGCPKAGYPYKLYISID